MYSAHCTCLEAVHFGHKRLTQGRVKRYRQSGWAGGHMHSNWLKARLGHYAPDSVCIYSDNCGLAIIFTEPRDKTLSTFNDNWLNCNSVPGCVLSTLSTLRLYWESQAMIFSIRLWNWNDNRLTQTRDLSGRQVQLASELLVSQMHPLGVTCWSCNHQFDIVAKFWTPQNGCKSL